MEARRLFRFRQKPDTLSKKRWPSWCESRASRATSPVTKSRKASPTSGANREGHLAKMRALVNELRPLDNKADQIFSKMRQARSANERERLHRRLTGIRDGFAPKLAQFCFEQKVIEEMVAIADNVWQQLQKTFARRHERLQQSAFYPRVYRPGQ